MGRFGQERDRVREVAANGLDHRKACEDQQRNENPTPANVMPMLVRAVAMSVPVSVRVPVPMTVRVLMMMRVLMRQMCAVACVMVIAVGLV